MTRGSSLKAALAKLSEREALAAEAERIARIGTFVFDIDTHTSVRSDELNRIWGFPERSGPSGLEVILEKVHPDDQQIIVDDYRRLLAEGGTTDAEVRIIVDGELRHVHMRGEVVQLAGRSGKSVIGTIQDITERKQAEATIAAQHARLKEMQSELIFLTRQSAMGTMAATLAHELNQPLTAISNYARGLARKLDGSSGPGEIAEILGALQDNALRAGEIIRRMREMAREGSFRKEPVDVGEMIRETARFTGLGRDCVAFDYDIRHSRTVYADRIQIQQVLVNLLRNACEAVEESGGGAITISSRDDGDDVIVCVIDSGPGIEPAVLPVLFEAKISTKPGGMGIGLSISRTIIEAHNGRIWAENRNAGARFCFSLPGG